MGVVLAHDVKGMPWVAWLVLMSVPLAVLLLMGLILEALKVRVSICLTISRISQLVAQQLPCASSM